MAPIGQQLSATVFALLKFKWLIQSATTRKAALRRQSTSDPYINSKMFSETAGP